MPTTQAKVRSVKNTLAVRNAQPDELAEFTERDKFTIQKLVDNAAESGDVVCSRTKDELCIQSAIRIGALHEFSLYINASTHEFDAFHRGVGVKIPFLRTAVSTAMSEATEVISFLRNFESTSKRADICSRQLALLSNRRYSAQDCAIALQFRSFGSAAYSAFREFVSLPSLRTMRRLVSSVSNEDDEGYLTRLFSGLSTGQRLCNLLVDEVYVRSPLEYQGHVVYGEATNQSGAIARTVLVFMITCMCGGPKLCVRLLPVCQLDSAFLQQQIAAICVLVEKCGGMITSVIMDNNRVNQSTYASMWSSETEPLLAVSPACANRPLFLLSDTTHLLKSLRNSWITEKDEQVEYVAEQTGKSCVAKWATLEKLCCTQDKLFQQARLTRKAVYPTPIERQGVAPCLRIFIDSTVAALRCANDEDTARFAELVLEFWKVCSVKCIGVVTRLNDKLRGVLEKADPW